MSDLAEIKQRSIEKWKGIREQLNSTIEIMGLQCSFCEVYFEPTESCPDCPAKRACTFALETIEVEAKKVRDKVTNLIQRIKRIKET